MTETLASPPTARRPGHAGHRRLSARTLGYLGVGWALAYLPIHVYWGLGGLSTPIGITGQQSGFRAANWGACVVIVGAALTCLALTQRWGTVLPAGLRRGTAWLGGAFGLAHWALYTAYCSLRLVGAVSYPRDTDLTEQQLRNFDWANVAYFELWFGVMGALLIVCALRSKRLDVLRRGSTSIRRTSWSVRLGTGICLAGIGVVVWGVFTFQPWVFAVVGPALLAAGLGTVIQPVAAGSARRRFVDQRWG